MVAITAPPSSLLMDGLMHSVNSAQCRAQLLTGFDSSKKCGAEVFNCKFSSKAGRQRGSFRRLAISRRLEDDVGYPNGNGFEKPEIDALIAAIIHQSEVEGSLSQAFQKISIEDWSKVIQNVGKRHWELALAVFGVFRETSMIFLKPNNGLPKGEQNGLPSNIIKVYTSMVGVLSKHGRLEEAESVLTEVQQLGFGLDLYLYNALLAGYARKGMVDRMLDCMVDMQKFGIQPDEGSYEQLIAAYLGMQNPEHKLALEVLDHMHKNQLKASFKIYSELINACWIRNEVDDADKCFSAMVAAGHTATAKVYFKMMQLHAQKGDHTRTEELFQMLKQAGLKPNAACYEYMLLAYCRAGCLNQAFSVFREAKQVAKPSLIVYNILLDACAKAGLHLQAMQLFHEVCVSGLKANVKTFTSAITALVRSGRCTKAEELYRKMLRQNISPTAHTYTSMIQAYTIKGWTRAGHEVCLAMRNNCVITSVAYNAMLIMYLRGGWYTEAAEVLSEMDGKGVEPGVSAYGVLITTCGDSSVELLPLVRSMETSRWETCRVVNQLLYLPLYESCEALLEGNIGNLPKDIMSYLQTMAETKDVEVNLCFYNALLDALWRKGLKRRAKAVMLAARCLLPWYKRPRYAKVKLMLDIRGLSLGAAQVAVIDWLSGVAKAAPAKNNQKMILSTGGGSESSSVKKAVAATLAELGSPFVEAPHGSGRLVASVHDVANWQAMYGISSALMLLDSNQPYIIQ